MDLHTGIGTSNQSRYCTWDLPITIPVSLHRHTHKSLLNHPSHSHRQPYVFPDPLRLLSPLPTTGNAFSYSILAEVKVKVTLRTTFSQSVSPSVSLGVEPYLGQMTGYEFLPFWQLRPYFYGTPSLTRRRVPLDMQPGRSSAAFLGSQSLETRENNLLSQIWGFPFRRLLRLAGSLRKYSTRPPHGEEQWLNVFRCIYPRIA